MNEQHLQKILDEHTQAMRIVLSKVPKTMEHKEAYDEELYTYTLSDAVYDPLTQLIDATYRRYIGCGDYEYAYTVYHPVELLKEQP